MHRAAPLLLLLALVVAPVVRAGDEDAKALYDQAMDHWKDPQPTELFRLLNEALGKKPGKVLRTQIRIAIGSAHQAKTGDLDAALAIYDEIIQANVKPTDDALKQLKADVMVRKATLLYSERNDTEGALRLMASAHTTWPLASTADRASQLFFRQGRMQDKGADDRKKALEGALSLAQDAITLAPQLFAEPELARQVAKFKLQLALVQLGLGRPEESKATYDSIAAADLTDACLYQQAVLQALQAGPPEGVAAQLKRFMTTRPPGPDGVKARNQLRKFIRAEPDFAPFLTREDWKTLVTDEALPAR